MNIFRQSKKNFKTFARNVYLDFLRTIFCKRFIRLRNYAIMISLWPIGLWSYIYQTESFMNFRNNKLYYKYTKTDEILIERGLIPKFTEKEEADISNYYRKNHFK